MTARHALRVVAAALSLGALSCRTPTEATLDFSTDTPCPILTGLSIAIYAEGTSPGPPATVTSQCDQSTGEIGTLVLTPGQLSSGIVMQSVTGTNVDPTTCQEGMAGCTYERRLINYVSHEDIVIPVIHPQVCEGIFCPQDRTCVKNAAGTPACAPYTVSCNADGTCTLEVGDGGDLTLPLDAGIVTDHDAGDSGGGVDSGVDSTVLDASDDVTDATVAADSADASDAADSSDATLAGDSGEPSDANVDDAADAADACPSGADMLSDPLNCGFCGHSCLGGSCQSSLCQPVTIARGQGSVGQLATDGVHVFWTRQASGVFEDLRRAPVGAIATSDSSVTWTSIVPATASVAGVALGAGEVFFTEGPPDADIGSSDQNGALTSLSLPAVGDSTWVETNATRVVYVDDDVLTSALMDGGDLTTYDEGLPDSGYVAVFAASSTWVYWTDGEEGAVWRAQLPHGSPELVYSASTRPGYIALDQNDFYVATEEGTIFSCPLAGCVPLGDAGTLVSGLTNGGELLADDGWMYWASQNTSGNNAISRCNPASCAATTQVVASSLDHVSDLISDSVAIYWGTTTGTLTDGWVERLAKTP